MIEILVYILVGLWTYGTFIFALDEQKAYERRKNEKVVENMGKVSWRESRRDR